MDAVLKELTLKSFPSIERLAKKNHLESQYMLGVAYLAGGPVEIDVATSFSWFKKAADHGHADAAFRVGMLLKEYDWAEKPDIEPVVYFSKSADLNSPAGMTALANIWTYDKINKDSRIERIKSIFIKDTTAIPIYELYRKAAALKYAQGYYYQGIHLLKGWGCNTSKKQAIEVFKNGAELKDRDCCYMFYLTSVSLNPSCRLEVLDYLVQAADLGHAASQYEYASLILNGIIENIPESQAVSWLRRAAMQLHPKAMERLAYLHYTGRNCDINYREAYKWATRASHFGLPTKSLIRKIWNKLDESDRVYVMSPSYNDDYNEFFKLSNKLFGAAGLQG